MIGTFVAVYKFLLNSLPLIPNDQLPAILRYTPPALSGQNSPGGSSSPIYMKSKEERKEAETPTLVEEERPASRDVFVRKPVARWHALVAGGLAGLAVAFETEGRRLTIAQQLFVRIQTASKVRPETVSMNHDLVRKALRANENTQRTTPGNRAKLEAELEAALRGDFGPRFGSCASVHPFFDSCWSVPLDRFLTVSAWMAPIYGALHFIPMLLFKRGEFMKHPWSMLKRSAYGTARSSAFLGVFVVIYQSFFCLKHNLYLSPLFKRLSPGVRFALISRASFWLGGLLAGLSLFVEEKRRRAELAMYVLPRGLESAWSVMRRRGWVPIVPGGENLLCAVGMSMVMATYQTSPRDLSGLVRRVLYQFIGPN
ncbi:hypothetical protein FRC06_006198 [Ceratobasidium sp. 370]|nr:hypothetical protein FRC06_006198 [Ceratobasidium sp. 370]